MKAVGLLTLYLGYWVSYYGLTQVFGGNWGFLDLGVPGHGKGDWLATPKDSGSPSALGSVLSPGNLLKDALGQGIPGVGG